MILEQHKQLEIQKVGSFEDGITAGISQESLPFVFELVSKQLYSNPIGSVVREITSNCFDAHKEAGVNEPVMIRYKYNRDDGHTIEFQDYGVGISPDRALNIYMNYFSSTKRSDNLQIGGFGIGSKTPLAYTDIFYITTIYEGLMYEYIFHKGETKPMLDSLHGWDEDMIPYEYYDSETGKIEERFKSTRVPIGIPTTERNGTTIKIQIEDNSYTTMYGQSDLDKFKKELKLQLAYFDSVYFSGWSGIYNDYTIYEGNTFKFRSDIEQSSGLHLCIGKVRYPIDFTKVKIPTNILYAPVAIRFEIGELKITPSRESIRYSEESVKLIEDRAKLVFNELQDMFSSQNPMINSLGDWIDNGKSKAKITFNNGKTSHYINIWEDSNLTKYFKFSPIANLNIKKTPVNLFFYWSVVGVVNTSKKDRYDYTKIEVNNNFINNNRFLIVDKNTFKGGSNTTNLYIQEQLGDYTIYIIARNKIDYGSFSEKLALKDSKDLGKAKTTSEYIKSIDAIVKSKSIGKYIDYIPSNEWVNNYKRSVKESTAAYIRRKNEEIFVRNLTYGYNGETWKIDDFISKTGIVVYGYKEDRAILETISNYMSSVYKFKVTAKFPFRDLTKKQKPFTVLQISKSVNLDNLSRKVITWDKFLKTKFFGKIYTANKMLFRLRTLNYENIEIRNNILNNFKLEFDDIEKCLLRYSPMKHGLRTLGLNEDLINTIKIYKPFVEIVDKFEAKYNFKIPLIKIIKPYTYDTEDFLEVISYLKSKKIRLKNKFYLKTEQQLQIERQVKELELANLLEIQTQIEDNFYSNIETDLLIIDKNIGNESF